MRRGLSILLAAVLLFSMVPVSVQAESEPFAVYVESVSAAAGTNEISVNIGVRNNPGIDGFSFCVDADGLVYLGAECLVDGYAVISTDTPYDVNIAWTDSQLFSGDGTIATVKFAVPADAEVGNSDVNIVFRNGYDSFYKTANGKEVDVSVVAENGYVSITERTISHGLEVSVGHSHAEDNGNEIEVPIVVDNGSEFCGFSFCVDYDTSRLSLINSEILLDGDYKVFNAPTGHNAGFAWTGDNCIFENGRIVLLRFKVKPGAKEGKAYVNIVFRDVYDSFYKTENNEEVDIPVNTTNGYIDVHSGHYFTDWEVVTEATCTHPGLEHYSCHNSNCTYCEDKATEQLPHSYGSWAKDASFDDAGILSRTCSECEGIESKAVTQISVSTNPNKLTYLEAKDSLDLSGGKLTVIYSDGSDDVISLADANVEGFDNSISGTQHLTVSYGGKTTAFDVNVKERTLESIVVSVIPSKTTFLEGKDALDLSGGKLTLSYDNGTVSVIDLSDASITVSGFDNTKVGDQTLIVSCGGKSTDYNITIQAKSLDRIAVTQLPAKTTYLEGKDSLDLTAGELTLTYNNGTTSVVGLGNDAVTVSGFDNTKVGEQTLNVSYGGKSTAFKISIQGKTLTGIAVTMLPTRVVYLEAKENLNLAGGKLALYFDNGTSSEIDLDGFGVSVSGFDNTAVGEQTLTVTYGGRTTTFKVTIQAKSLQSIAVTTLPIKTIRKIS